MRQEQVQKQRQTSVRGRRGDAQDTSGTADRTRARTASRRASTASGSAARFLARTER